MQIPTFPSSPNTTQYMFSPHSRIPDPLIWWCGHNSTTLRTLDPSRAWVHCLQHQLAHCCWRAYQPPPKFVNLSPCEPYLFLCRAQTAHLWMWVNFVPNGTPVANINTWIINCIPPKNYSLNFTGSTYDIYLAVQTQTHQVASQPLDNFYKPGYRNRIPTNYH